MAAAAAAYHLRTAHGSRGHTHTPYAVVVEGGENGNLRLLIYAVHTGYFLLIAMCLIFYGK